MLQKNPIYDLRHDNENRIAPQNNVVPIGKFIMLYVWWILFDLITIYFRDWLNLNISKFKGHQIDTFWCVSAYLGDLREPYIKFWITQSNYTNWLKEIRKLAYNTAF